MISGARITDIFSEEAENFAEMYYKEVRSFSTDAKKIAENLGKEDIHLVCYNFMPVFDWTRTELARKRPDGSTVLAYTQAAVDALNPEDMFHSISS